MTKQLMAITLTYTCLALLGTAIAQSAGNTSTVATAPEIAPPPNLVSVNSSARARSWLEGSVKDANSSMPDAFITKSDLTRIEAGGSPSAERFVVVLQSKDSRFRFVDEQLFNQIAASARKKTFDKRFVGEANQELKAASAKGEAVKGMLIEVVRGERPLIDEPNCFSRFVSAQYSMSGTKTAISEDMVQSFVRIDGQLFVIDAFAKHYSDADMAWMVNDVRAWLASLPHGK